MNEISINHKEYFRKFRDLVHILKKYPQFFLLGDDPYQLKTIDILCTNHIRIKKTYYPLRK